MRAIQIHDGRISTINIGADVQRRIRAARAERRAAIKVDAAILSAFEGNLTLADLELALRDAERRLGTVGQ